MRRGFTLIELLVVIVIISILAALLLPALIKALCLGRQAAVESLIQNLSMAAKAYEFDQAVYPPGNGTGSNSLVAALSVPGPKGQEYFEFRPDMLTSAGHIINGIWGQPEILYYRRNFPNPPPEAWNKNSFDLWAKDCANDPHGVNNW